MEILAKWMAGPQGVRRAYYERVGYCRLRVLKREMNADNSVSAHSGQWEIKTIFLLLSFRYE